VEGATQANFTVIASALRPSATPRFHDVEKESFQTVSTPVAATAMKSASAAKAEAANNIPATEQNALAACL